MLATLAGTLALFSGLALLLLPLLLPELSRPRDSVWGALVLLLGLELVSDAERLRGSPMLAVLAAALLIGRLAQEVGRARWLQLSSEERLRLASIDHWRTRIDQLTQLLAALLAGLTSRLGALSPKPRAGGVTKRWVRPESQPQPAATSAEEPSPEPSIPHSPEPADREPQTGEAQAAEPQPAEPQSAEPQSAEPESAEPQSAEATIEATEVEDFTQIEALLRQAEAAASSPATATSNEVSSAEQPEPRPAEETGGAG